MGAEHARALVAEGAKVVIGDILDDEGKALAAELGAAARYVHLDVTSPEDWQTAVTTAVDEFGKVNVLVNNAGIVNGSTIQQFRLDKWKQILDVNLTGTFLGIQAVADLMIEPAADRSSTCPRSKAFVEARGRTAMSPPSGVSADSRSPSHSNSPPRTTSGSTRSTPPVSSARR